MSQRKSYRPSKIPSSSQHEDPVLASSVIASLNSLSFKTKTVVALAAMEEDVVIMAEAVAAGAAVIATQAGTMETAAVDGAVAAVAVMAAEVGDAVRLVVEEVDRVGSNLRVGLDVMNHLEAAVVTQEV